MLGEFYCMPFSLTSFVNVHSNILISRRASHDNPSTSSGHGSNDNPNLVAGFGITDPTRKKMMLELR
jgi:hypothetical protein